MKPRVIIHNAVSLDGRIDRFAVDIGLFYEIASRFAEDVTLAGSDTLLQSPEGAALREEPEDAGPGPGPEPDAADSRPLLAVPDGRGRIRNWDYLRRQPYWRDVLALGCASTPADHIERLKRQGVPYFLAGRDRVDLAAALESLNQRTGAKTVRVESRGTLNGVLLRARLVDEVSLLIHPRLVGGISPRSIFRAPDLESDEDVIPLSLVHLEKLDGGVVWARYELTSGRAGGS